jgi:hypothetical protein
MTDPDKELKANKKIAWDRATEYLNKPNESLIAEIFFHSKDKLTQNPDERVSTTLAIFSSLLVKLSWQAEESTRKIVRLTLAIVFLTVVLLMVTSITAIPVIKDFITPTKQTNLEEQTYQQTEKSKQQEVKSPMGRPATKK